MSGKSSRGGAQAFRFLLFASLLAGGLFTSAPKAHAQAAASARHTARYAPARESADHQAKEWLDRGIPGLALAVAIDGNIVYSEGFGYADLEERVPVWPTTKFRIGRSR